MSFIKIIYFDESFVADFMQIIAGGEIKKTTEFLSNINSDASANGEVELDFKNARMGKLVEFLTGFGLNASGKIDGGTSYKSEKVVKNILENTLLADFLDLIKKDNNKIDKNKKCKGIMIFPRTAVRPELNSFTFFMLMSPYVSMINGDMPITDDTGNSFNIDIKHIGDAIESGRGYYEFIARHENEEVILRFNISAFRNNYTMSDLPKMQLTYYAIFVGYSEKSNLQIQTEFLFGTHTPSRINYGDWDNQTNQCLELKVYDVVLAGIDEQYE